MFTMRVLSMMRIPLVLAWLIVVLASDNVNEEHHDEFNVRSMEVMLIDVRNVIRSSLQKCIANWDNSLESFFYDRLIENYWKLDEEDEIVDGLDAFLNQNQIHQLRHLHEHGDSDAIEKAVRLPLSRKTALIDEFLGYKLKRIRRDTATSQQQIVDFEEEVLEPEELEPELLAWQTLRHKNLISQMITGKASKWEVMNEIGDQFYHLRKEVRARYKTNLQNYCERNLKNVIGEENFNVIRGMYLDTVPMDQIETKFNELVAELPDERERLLSDHYAVFCRKIFRLVPFEPTDLTTWLTSSQKMALGEMIQDPNVKDAQIYDKMYEFYKNATGEQKEEASDIIEAGCRHFIAHMFGDDNAEELEELRESGVMSKQKLAAKLATHVSEVSNALDRKRAESSLSICSRIYLGYDGSCECNGHASVCDSFRHYCLNCTGNTYGIQCEMCMESFSGNPLGGGECTPIEAEETSCNCNNHSDVCDTEGKCQLCLHNTTGDHCEGCAAGFYGDAKNGSRDDCTRCPCPDGGDCFVNEQNLVECNECPTGKHGIICEEEGAAQKTVEKAREEVEEGKEEPRKKAKPNKEISEKRESTENYLSHSNMTNQTISVDGDG
ncbi:unnamed protein product [Angiostrongylus costaricensis]|uniref:Laminin EGF-like domain-containing protein n=1 Tax=Angiostrongylus costaricensis TaxID=334426 RepID=A0A0R3PGG0_ANGCS|nr:unnamed protein product [Angiostrongylus costaricensis]